MSEGGVGGWGLGGFSFIHLLFPALLICASNSSVEDEIPSKGGNEFPLSFSFFFFFSNGVGMIDTLSFSPLAISLGS